MIENCTKSKIMCKQFIYIFCQNSLKTLITLENINNLKKQYYKIFFILIIKKIFFSYSRLRPNAFEVLSRHI